MSTQLVSRNVFYFIKFAQLVWLCCFMQHKSEAFATYSRVSCSTLLCFHYLVLFSCIYFYNGQIIGTNPSSRVRDSNSRCEYRSTRLNFQHYR